MNLPRLAAGAWVMCALALSQSPALAQGGGSVRIPLEHYDALRQLEQGGNTSEAGYAFSDVRIEAAVQEDDDSAAAEITVSATVRILEDTWTLVPFSASGAALLNATVDGRAAELVARGGVLSWPTNQAGTHTLRWTYTAPARRYGDGRVISISTPPASARLTATIPGADRGATVIPSSDFTATSLGTGTQISASVPATGAVQIAWRGDRTDGYTLSRAHYTGTVDEDTVHFEVDLTVDVSGNGGTVPLLPTHLALEEVLVDRVASVIGVEQSRYVVPLSSRGRHRIHATFQVPIQRADGLPHVDLQITPTPVSRFDLRLPGEREITVTPLSGVHATRADGHTVATFHVPMSEHVSIAWAEAVPVDAQEVETRAHANIVHIVRPDEGVLSMRAFARWEITRGTLSRVSLALPDSVNVNSVESSAGVVSDWRVSDESGGRTLAVFLDREVEGELALEIVYERAWPMETRTSETFAVPILHAEDVHRQRGMVALLASRDLTLEPREELHLTRVGDNLLPSEIHDRVEGTVAHTWRYLGDSPRLVAVGAIRQPEAARFDAQVDTLVSLGDVSTTVTTLLDVDVKSGTLDTLRIALPEGLNLLEVSAPSLRRHDIEEEDGTRVLVIELTQPMEGRFRVEVVSERITGQEEELRVPLLDVQGAEVERGRLGVEALAPFQVDAAEIEGLSPVEPSELPEQLLMRTDNPILHAYRYAQADPAPRFSVRITRHSEIETPHAVIDEASYRTLYTEDGVAVTVASYVVRNRRQQFLRVGLPAGSEVWSATVDGRSETPALEAGSDEAEPTVLVNIVSAAEAFNVTLVYATAVPELGAAGRLATELPTLDVVVTRARWEVYLPQGAVYADPSSSMSLIESGQVALSDAGSFSGGGESFALEVPAEGVRYVFTKMYPGRSGERVAFSIPYASGWGGPFALLLSLLGALLLGLSLLAFAILELGLPVPESLRDRLPISLSTYRDHTSVRPPRARRKHAAILFGVAVFGAALLTSTVGYLSVMAWPAGLVGVFIALGALGMVIGAKLQKSGLYEKIAMTRAAVTSRVQRKETEGPATVTVEVIEEAEPRPTPPTPDEGTEE